MQGSWRYSRANRATGVAFVVAVAVAATALVPVMSTKSAAAAPDPTLAWAREDHGARTSIGQGIAVDPFGNTIVTGWFFDRAILGEGDREVTLTAVGGASDRDAFLAKYDADGQLLWATSIGGQFTDLAYDVGTDAQGNIFVTGEAGDDTILSSIATTPSFPGGKFLARFDRDGNPNAVRAAQLTSSDTSDLAVKPDGSVVVAGGFFGQATFGFGGADAVTVDSGAAVSASYVVSYANNLVVNWARAGENGMGMGVAVDTDGYVITSGSQAGPGTFGEGATEVTLAGPGAFVAKYSPEGALQWVRLGEDAFLASGYDVAVNPSGQIFVAGSFFDDMTFSGPAGPITVTAVSVFADVFVASFAPDGTLAWLRTALGDGNDEAFAVTVDALGNVVVTGTFDRTQTFDGGAPIALTAVFSDLFLASYTAGGALNWAQGDGSPWAVSGRAIAAGTASLHITGQFRDTATFGEGTNEVTLGGGGSTVRAAFVARYATGVVPPTRIAVPSVLARTGRTTVRIVGAGLVPGSTFDLVGPGGAVLVPNRLVVKPSGQELEGRFDLVDAPLGQWSVRITVPGEGTTTLPNAITTVEPTAEPQLALSLSVRNAVRPLTPFLATMSVQNFGDTDVSGLPLTLNGLPPGTQVEGLFEEFAVDPDPVPGLPVTPPEPGEIAPTIEAPDGTLAVPLITGPIPAHGRADYPVRITLPRSALGQPIQVTMTGCPPAWDGTGQPPSSPSFNLRKCMAAAFEEALDFALGLLPGGTCVHDGVEFAVEEVTKAGISSFLVGAAEGEANSANFSEKMMQKLGGLAVTCLLSVLPIGKVALIAQKVWELAQLLQNRANTINACLPELPPSTRNVTVANSIDPNDKVGPDGAGPAGYTTPDVPVDYSIFFENLAAASAPAQRVVVTDVVDPVVFDPATIELGAITLAEQVIAVPPPGLREWSTTVDLGDPTTVLGIDVAFDEPTSALMWTFTTLDRVSGLPTDDALAGFLPPNVVPPEGQAGARFFVEPRSRSDGVVLTNEASIVFDVNEPITTGPWVNTLDGTPPVSAIDPLPAVSASTAIPLSWSATDALAGVDTVEIWFRENGGPPEVWARPSAAAATEAVFPGIDGSAYEFWTRAVDRAGNVEMAPAAADAVTTIQIEPPTTSTTSPTSTTTTTSPTSTTTTTTTAPPTSTTSTTTSTTSTTAAPTTTTTTTAAPTTTTTTTAAPTTTTTTTAPASGPTISIHDVTKHERDRRAHRWTFRVTASQKLTHPVKVTWMTVNDSAQGGSDFVARSGAFTLHKGRTGKAHVWVKGDRLPEPDETFKVVITSVQGATVSDGTAIGTILDDD